MILKENLRVDAFILERQTEEVLYKKLVRNLVDRIPMSLLKSMFSYELKTIEENAEYLISVGYESDPINDKDLILPEDREDLARLVQRYQHMSFVDFMKAIGH